MRLTGPVEIIFSRGDGSTDLPVFNQRERTGPESYWMGFSTEAETQREKESEQTISA